MPKFMFSLVSALLCCAFAQAAGADCITMRVISNGSSESVTAYLKLFNADDTMRAIALREGQKTFKPGQTGDLQICGSAIKANKWYTFKISTRVFSTEQMDITDPAWKSMGNTATFRPLQCQIGDFGSRKGVIVCRG